MTVIDRRLATRLVTFFALAAPTGLCAQASPLVLEVRGGGAIPVSAFANGSRVGEGGAAAPSLGVQFVMAGQGRRALYGGFSQHRFGCAGAGCPTDGQYVATGFDVGFRFDLRSTGSLVPWVRLGAITTRVEMPALPGAQEGVSELGFGGEAGVGLYVGASSPVALVPGVRLAAVNTTLPGGALLRMRYVVLDVALALAF